ncbi:MAG: winged helix-turn-helix domain-containing protein [Theionarchaea archaeon]|nr:winged helix-turn-helix domain-containing protein [Theionarchaea archaeon]
MGKITQEERMRNYYKIYGQIYEWPIMSLLDIAVNTGLSRNTVSKYLQEMYTKNIIVGPHLRMNPSSNYREYVYLLNFADPWLVFKGLEQFPHVLYHGITFGDWNTLVITDSLLDFSKLIGFQEVVYRGVRGYSSTPKGKHLTWDEWFKTVNTQVARADLHQMEYKNRVLPHLPWEKDEWKLYHAFKYNLRRKVTPLLKKINVRYETYMKWMETLETYCSTHTGFYPEGYNTYMSYCFLFVTDAKEVHSLFSLVPTTPFIIGLGHHLLVFASIPSLHVTRMSCLIYHMKAKNLIREYKQAVVLFHHQCQLFL